jgi:RNA polymerase sigma-70 factor, ECF subfamily
VPRDDYRPLVSEALVGRLYRKSGAARWTLAVGRFAAALEASAAKAFAGKAAAARDVERYAAALHLEDLALACACADGHPAAWDHFVAQHRPVLYRAADALDPSGGAREIADSLYAELYGLTEREGTRRSLFAYYHGRSSLATWLRAILAQRQIDRVRSVRRLEPLEEEPAVAADSTRTPDPDRPRYLAVVRRTLGEVLSALPARDRLRLGLYYAQQLTLAQIGRVLGEHEATVSRQLAKVRREIRTDLERRLRAGGLNAAAVEACFEYAADAGGALELGEMLSVAADGKNPGADRSNGV